MPSQTSVAVIGSGTAGTLAAWRLREKLGADARIEVFEKEPEVGGRAHYTQFAGERIELGGTLIHTDNRRLIELAASVGVELGPRGSDVLGGADKLSVWDGKRFLIQAPESGVGLPLVAVLHYGPFNLLKLQGLAKKAKAAWNSVYALQDSGRLFETPEDLIAAAGLGDFVAASLEDLAARSGISKKVVDQFVTPVLRDMYNQTSSIVALAGLVGLAGAGLAGGSLVSVVEGNATLLSEALKAARVEVHVGTPVSRIESVDNGAWVDAGQGRVHFDAVIVAAPLELAGIEFVGVDVPALGRRYQDVHVTLVAGQVSSEYFGVKAVPVDVLTVDEPSIGFKALGQTGYSKSLKVPVWKFFSTDALDDEFLARIFPDNKGVYRHHWKAYPVLDPAPTFRPFRLAQGLYQVNDFESAVSTLETEGALGWSVADLVVSDLSRAASSSDGE